MKTLSIVIPVYNERSTLRSVIAQVLAVDLRPLSLRRQIVVIDDLSTDGTRAIVESLREDWRAVVGPVLSRRGLDAARLMEDAEIITLFHPENRGKGSAVRSGLQRATGDLILIQDADLEYDPRDYPKLVTPILEDRADVVYGSRYLASDRRVLHFWHTQGNRLLTLLGNLATDLDLTDMETCYKVFRADVLRGLHLESERFGIDPELTVKIARQRWRIFEVPISYSGRGYALGKKIGWRDAVDTLVVLARHRLGERDVEAEALTDTLQKMRGMRAFNEQLFLAIRPFLGRRILQVGAGFGAVTDYMLRCGDVIAADTHEVAVRTLRSSYALHDTVEVIRWQLGDPPPPALEAGVDTLVAINVLDQLEDEGAALAAARRLLEPTGGRLVMLGPAHPGMLGSLDRAMGRKRRYTMETLRASLEGAGFEIEHTRWFNLLGLAGWALSGGMLEKERLPAAQLGLYNTLSTALLPLESRLPLPTGLSILAVARARRGSAA